MSCSSIVIPSEARACPEPGEGDLQLLSLRKTADSSLVLAFGCGRFGMTTWGIIYAESINLQESYHRRMNLPESRYLRTPPPMLKVFKWQTQYADRQRLYQIASMCRIHFEPVLRQA